MATTSLSTLSLQTLVDMALTRYDKRLIDGMGEMSVRKRRRSAAVRVLPTET